MTGGHALVARRSVAVAGAGIIGLSIALRLAQRGYGVTVYDTQSIGGEASWAGAGMLSPGGEIDGPSELASLAIESRRMYASFVRELEAASGISIDYQECGALDLAYSDSELQELEQRAVLQVTAGIRSKPVTPEHVRTFWPRVATNGLAGARFYPEDGIVNPREVVHALTAACRKLNVSLREKCAVEGVAVQDDCVRLRSIRETSCFGAAVIAAGAWSSSIEIHGVPKLPQSEPVKGHLIGYEQPLGTCATILRHGHTYLLQRANGLLIAGSSIEHVGFDRQIADEVTKSLQQRAAFVLPHLAETSISQAWTGFRPASDELHVGRWHSDRLFLAYGHFRNGILLAPVTAERIARQM